MKYLVTFRKIMYEISAIRGHANIVQIVTVSKYMANARMDGTGPTLTPA